MKLQHTPAKFKKQKRWDESKEKHKSSKLCPYKFQCNIMPSQNEKPAHYLVIRSWISHDSNFPDRIQ